MRISTRILFFTSAVFGGIIGLSADSSATWRALDAAACRSASAGGYAKYDQNGNLYTSNSLGLFCPVVDGSDFSKASKTLHVHIDQSNPNSVSSAASCYNSESSMGAICNTQVSTSAGTGIKDITVTSNWTSSDYGYVLIYLAPIYNGTTTKVKGYYWTG
jgi:hypothetical protein